MTETEIPTFAEQAAREAVGVFDSAKDLEAAVDALESSGFNRAEITLLAPEKAVVEQLGHVYRKVEELEDEPGVPRAAYVSTETIGDAEGALIGGLFYVGATAAAGATLLSGGTFAAAVGAVLAAGGAGGLIGSVLARLVGHQHSEHLAEQLRHGGLLLWVKTRDADHEARACQTFEKHRARDVHVHALAPLA